MYQLKKSISGEASWLQVIPCTVTVLWHFFCHLRVQVSQGLEDFPHLSLGHFPHLSLQYTTQPMTNNVQHLLLRNDANPMKNHDNQDPIIKIIFDASQLAQHARTSKKILSKKASGATCLSCISALISLSLQATSTWSMQLAHSLIHRKMFVVGLWTLIPLTHSLHRETCQWAPASKSLKDRCPA